MEGRIVLSVHRPGRSRAENRACFSQADRGLAAGGVPSSSWCGEEGAEGGEDAARVPAVHGHAEPVGGLLAFHGLDPFGYGPHVVAASHRGEGAEQEAEGQGQVLAERVGAPPAVRASAELHPRL